MNSKDYYSILGVAPTATEDEIKKSYRKLASTHHPDHGGDENKFKDISEAYSVLSEDSKRKEYDFMRTHGGDPMGGFEDIFSSFFGFGNRRQDPNRPMRGGSIKYNIRVPLQYFIFGGRFTFNIAYIDACPKCGGTGAEEKTTCSSCKGTGQVLQNSSNGRGVFMTHATMCQSCAGKGFIITKRCSCNTGSINIEKQIEIDIPAGAEHGHNIIKRGDGLAGKNGGPQGDLLVIIEIKMPVASELSMDQTKLLRGL